MTKLPAYGKKKLDEGAQYFEFVRQNVSRYGLTFWAYDDPIFQRKGETTQGCEVKLDMGCIKYDRLSIEIAEKSDRNLPHWTPSGIFKEDNSWCYIQGNYELIFVFSKRWLIRWFSVKTPATWESHGTVRKFYLPLDQARTACLFAVDGNGNRVDGNS